MASAIKNQFVILRTLQLLLCVRGNAAPEHALVAARLAVRVVLIQLAAKDETGGNLVKNNEYVKPELACVCSLDKVKEREDEMEKYPG
mgnify:CR=1 FL=1